MTVLEETKMIITVLL